jgi:hypothetical protein
LQGRVSAPSLGAAFNARSVPPERHGDTRAGFVCVGDLANFMSGTHIEFWMQQTASFDNFAKPIEYACQFVVESQ